MSCSPLELVPPVLLLPFAKAVRNFGDSKVGDSVNDLFRWSFSPRLHQKLNPPVQIRRDVNVSCYFEEKSLY